MKDKKYASEFISQIVNQKKISNKTTFFNYCFSRYILIYLVKIKENFFLLLTIKAFKISSTTDLI